MADYLHSHGVMVPKLGFGTWQLRGENCKDAVALALAEGYRHLDTAQIYENEAEVGAALSESAVGRDAVFVTTKIWMENVSAGKMAASLESSLRKLQTDYVDLLLLHWPVPSVSLGEQLDSLQAIQKTGKTRLIGVSNYPVALMQQAVQSGTVIANNQVEYHPFLSQQPVLDFCRLHDIFVTAYSPLARGNISDSGVIQAIAQVHGKTTGQVALRWLIQQEGVAAIPKAGTIAHIKANFAIHDFALSESDMAAIAALATSDGRLISPDFAPEWDKVA